MERKGVKLVPASDENRGLEEPELRESPPCKGCMVSREKEKKKKKKEKNTKTHKQTKSTTTPTTPLLLT